MVNCQPPAASLRDTIEDPPRTARCGAAGRLMILLALGSLAVSAASCAKARAETVPDGPPLATPAPPPRVLAPVEEVLAEAPVPAELPVELPTAPTSDRRPAPRRPAAADTQKPPEPQPPIAPPVVAEAPVRQPAADPVEEQKIRDILLRASRDLNNVDYRRLQGDGKAQYEQSKRFSELAEAAIKDRNYPLAATHADKAATIAEQLRGQ
jgi:hypothetical protein